jgi:hypothetical protein
MTTFQELITLPKHCKAIAWCNAPGKEAVCLTFRTHLRHGQFPNPGEWVPAREHHHGVLVADTPEAARAVKEWIERTKRAYKASIWSLP